MNKSIIIGVDHGGLEAKNSLVEWLEQKGFSVTDLGAHEDNPEDDYPPIAFAVGEAVASSGAEAGVLVFGVLVCRSGAGMTIAANKVRGIRAVVAQSPQSTEHARRHNNANVLTLSGDWTDLETMKDYITLFTSTPFSQEARHVRRLQQITDYERSL